ncbi:hypothetical protein WAF17_08180 [Bernardetia sp. ABR2-2B]|uniref:hypothetical protein n=1 Tax=Bernardetia sp. ABR2-2B TaxID=3127472 RepID=UPI0030CABEC4
MKKTGICPKCNSTEVYYERTTRSERNLIYISTFGQIRFDLYACIECGYIEEYIADEYLENRGKMDTISLNWKKVKQN